jgi:hypothetical protein
VSTAPVHTFSTFGVVRASVTLRTQIAVEEDLATGRVCQAFLQKNGLVP